jgi:hypothetical protein
MTCDCGTENTVRPTTVALNKSYQETLNADCTIHSCQPYRKPQQFHFSSDLETLLTEFPLSSKWKAQSRLSRSKGVVALFPA